MENSTDKEGIMEENDGVSLKDKNTSGDVLDVHDLTQNELNENEEVEEPEVGMIFNSAHEVFDYYKRFGQYKSFGVIKRTSKISDDNTVKYVTYACAKARAAKCNSNPKPKPTTKTCCKANINFIIDADGRCTISRVNLEHNHDLNPSNLRFLRCNKEIAWSVKKRLELNDQAGISISKTFHSFVVEAGGYENLAFGERECRNYIANARKSRLGVGDAEAIHSYFVRMKNKNVDFFYNIEFDDENRIQSIFWADSRSRAAYESFGDVITFDTTYLTNKYDMPFAPFVGINNYGQSLLLGCGLLSHEDTETYIWLFRSWLECMKGVSPKAIITDQCKAIKGAIANVFPKSRHRLFLWHIMSKIPAKLSGYAEYNAISLFLMNVVYDSLTQADFDAGWSKMIDMFNLRNSEWLKLLYAERRFWVPAYLKDVFWAGMSTTQRSESMNSFFDGYINAKTTLRQFVEQYDNALRSKIEKENVAEFASFNSVIPLITDFKIEKQFQEAYTIQMFKKFQEELRGLYYCNVSLVDANGAISIFQVRENVCVGGDAFRKLKVYEVLYNKAENVVKCVCGLFEFKGIICRHAISVLTDQCVKEVSSRYILDRWRKDIKRKYTSIRSSFDNKPTDVEHKRYQQLHKICEEVVDMAIHSNEKYQILLQLLDQVKEKFIAEEVDCNKFDSFVSKIATKKDNGISNESSSQKKFLNPLKVRTKGRPPSKRKESTVEQIIKRRKKKISKEVHSNDLEDGNSSRSHNENSEGKEHMLTNVSMESNILDAETQEINSNNQWTDPINQLLLHQQRTNVLPAYEPNQVIQVTGYQNQATKINNQYTFQQILQYSPSRNVNLVDPHPPSGI